MKTHSTMSAEELEAWRIKHGFTNRQAAERLGIGERTIYRYAAGVPIPQTIKLLAEAIGANSKITKNIGE